MSIRTLTVAFAAAALVAHATAAPQSPSQQTPSPAAAKAPAAAPAATPAPAADAETQTEKELKRLSLEAALREQQLQVELAALKAEKARLEAQLALNATKAAAGAEPDKAKVEAMQRAAEVGAAALRTELAPGTAEMERLKHAQALAATRLEAELSANSQEMARMKSAQDLVDAQHRAKLAAMRREAEELAIQNQLAVEKRKAEQMRAMDEQALVETEARKQAAQLQKRDGADKLRELVDAPMVYADEPLQDGVLTITDRRIDLNGPIVTGTADHVCDRIDYYNNLDAKKPIFLVIDNSPGGSVQQGYRIVKSIETSDAPVHVVVKSFAASMAATIATLAKHSYALPNAVILHHQMSSAAIGNMTDIEQEVQTLREWERRLAEPIARKMGITLDEFKARMYQAKKTGDWDEFADKAVQLKWIDRVVDDIREVSIRKKPADKPASPFWMFMMARDESGKPYCKLPPLLPYDCYFMVNPRGFYRVDGR
ncbi:MAG: ATP-dependent Clp protease proteolytic subunit [Planctomycetota bacterium]|jgi:ATP-dependent Clp protease protease subunit